MIPSDPWAFLAALAALLVFFYLVGPSVGACDCKEEEVTCDA